jgi:hypothetical protein
MTKALDKSIEIQDLYLLEKSGGKSGDLQAGMTAAVITVSDSALPARGKTNPGPPFALFSKAMVWQVPVVEVLPDEAPRIAAGWLNWPIRVWLAPSLLRVALELL